MVWSEQDNDEDEVVAVAVVGSKQMMMKIKW